ncbi:hydroxypyruvate isomerase family protein [Paraburkholderia sp. BCC1886]|uniref:hydroxypyruvate isomerase family protein n=1 Tax=Paraburkholderia sp. BCC1886 TaxID=2562670 RepID=UPI001181DC5F|nr:TIM barrel protein [Paraburkholderia sp. BCC1886]
MTAATGSKSSHGPRRGEIRFAANLKWLFTELSFPDRFEAAASSGFTAVEYASPYEYDPAVLQRALQKWNLQQVLINTPAGDAGTLGVNGYACIPGYTETFRSGVHRALDYASALNCRLIHLMAGRMPAGCSQSEAEDVFRANLVWAAERAANCNVTFVLECLNQQDAPGYFLSSLDHASTFIREIPKRNVKLLFDFYHAGMSGVNPLDAFARHRADIAHIQVADVPGRHEPGTGTLPWAAIARAIARADYPGWIGCEYRPESTTTAGLHWRREFRKSFED